MATARIVPSYSYVVDAMLLIFIEPPPLIVQRFFIARRDHRLVGFDENALERGAALNRGLGEAGVNSFRVS
jgi:hypothetical protein